MLFIFSTASLLCPKCVAFLFKQVLGGYEQAVRLAALLRLEGLCEALVAGLAAAAGLSAPAPHSSAAEAKQVCTSWTGCGLHCMIICSLLTAGGA